MPVTAFDALSSSVASVAREAQENPSSFQVAGFPVVGAVFTKPDLPDPSALCVAGERLSSTGGECEAILCGANEYVRGNRCRSCQVGTHNTAGDSADGDNTECTQNVCTCANGVAATGARCIPHGAA